MMALSIYYAALSATLIIFKDFQMAQATTISGLNYTTFTKVLADIYPNTTKLTINTTSIDNLDFDTLLVHAPLLKSLIVMGNSNLSTLTGQMNFPRLQNLDFFSNKISAYPSFKSCPELTVYSIRRNVVALPELNMTDFKKCPKLWKFALHNVGLTHFPNFTQLNPSVLRKIEILQNNLVSVDDGALFGLYGLNYLRLQSNHMPTIPSLRDLVALRELSLGYNTMADKGAMDLDWLRSMPNLLAFYFGSSFTFTEAPDLSGMPLLTKFSIVFDPAASVYLSADYLNAQPDITQIYIKNVKMEELLPRRPSKRSLTMLRLIECTIGNLTVDTFEEFERLNVLELKGTNVPYLPLLMASRSTLASLTFAYSKYITSIPVGYFLNFTQLSKVYMYNNKVSEIQYLGESATMQSINLDGNKISKIVADAFEGFCCLTSLKLRNNMLQTISFMIPPSTQSLELTGNDIVTVKETEFPLGNGTLKKVTLYKNNFECHRKMCFALTGPLSSMFELDLHPCSTPSDLVGKPKAEVAHSLSCPEEACYHVPAIANASSEVMSKYVWYTCNNNLLFTDGVCKKRLLCQSAILSTDDIVSAGCKGGVGIRKREFTQYGRKSYSDDSSNMIGKTIRVDEIELKSPNDLSCARVCSRLADCVGYKVVHSENGAKGKCEVNIVQP